MLFDALRRGETCAVTWSDFDEVKGVITVSRSLCTETLKFKDTKTKAGRRTIPLDADTISYLKKLRAIQAEKALGMGKSLRDACICAKVGTAHMHPENLGRPLRRFGRANGFPESLPISCAVPTARCSLRRAPTSRRYSTSWVTLTPQQPYACTRTMMRAGA